MVDVGEGKQADLLVYGGCAVSIVSTVSLVIVNKWIFDRDGFQFMATLSSLHFAFTALATRLLLGAEFFEYKSPQGGTSKVLPVAFGSLCSVLFMNMNLAYNSVVFYQISKVGCVPLLLLMQHWLYGTTISHKTRICQTTLVAGVGLTCLSDPQLNFNGAVLALLSVVATVFAQILTNKKQKDLQLNPMQLLYHASPWIFAGMVLCIPVFDSLHEIKEFCTGAHLAADQDQRMLTAGVFSRILLSCALALLVNISNYLLLGKSSVLIQQAINHIKTVLVLLFGLIMFSPHVVAANLLGIVLALVGNVGYTEIKRRAVTKTTAPSLGGPAASSSTSVPSTPDSAPAHTAAPSPAATSATAAATAARSAPSTPV